MLGRWLNSFTEGAVELVIRRVGFDYNRRPFLAQLFNILQLPPDGRFCFGRDPAANETNKKSYKSVAKEDYLNHVVRVGDAMQSQIMLSDLGVIWS